jgi:hypothetical protein
LVNSIIKKLSLSEKSIKRFLKKAFLFFYTPESFLLALMLKIGRSGKVNPPSVIFFQSNISVGLLHPPKYSFIRQLAGSIPEILHTKDTIEEKRLEKVKGNV